MEQWRVVLRDYISAYNIHDRKYPYMVDITVIDGDSSVREAVYSAVKTGCDNQALSTDCKDVRKSATVSNRVFVTVGSKQAQDEFISRLGNVRSEVDSWRATEAEREEKEKLKQDLAASQKQVEDLESEQDDPWSAILVLCVAAAIIILLTD